MVGTGVKQGSWNFGVVWEDSVVDEIAAGSTPGGFDGEPTSWLLGDCPDSETLGTDLGERVDSKAISWIVVRDREFILEVLQREEDFHTC